MNIFNSKKRERVKIIVDNREVRSGIPKLLEEFDLEFKNLEFGDYIIKGIVIERKSANDFISSMINGRLYSQLEGLKEQKSLLIVEDISEVKKLLNPNSIRGFILSITLNYNVPVIFSENKEETARYLNLIAKKENSERKLNFSKKAKTDLEQARYILESFPGVGPKTSKLLINEFKSLSNIFSSDKERLKKILGKKSEKITSLFNKKFI